MLILDRTQRNWALISSVLFALATAAFCWTHYSSPDGARGGTFPGLFFGITSAAMMFYAGLLGARRRVPSWQFLGSGSFWMRSHLWIGTLTVPFALFHTGFRFGGPLEVLLWVLFIAVILSGFWGLAMQNVLPKMMLNNLPRETFIQQIPHLCTVFVAKSDELVTKKCGPLEFGIAAAPLEKNSRATRELAASNPGADANLGSVGKSPVKSAVESKGVDLAPPLNSENAPVSVKTKPDLKAMLAAKPNLTSVARTTTSPASGSETSDQTSTGPKTDPPAGKPDPKAILAAARAKKELAAKAGDPTAKTQVAAEEPVLSIAASSASQTPATAKMKPDPKAILAAARAKKELEAGNVRVADEVASASTPQEVPADVVAANQAPAGSKPKPDPKAILAAARAKKELEAANVRVADEVATVSTPQEVPADVVPANQTPAGSKPKPDPKAILAAARAKKELEAANLRVADEVATASTPQEVPVDVVPANQTPAGPKPKPDPKAILAAARAKKELEAANVRVADEVASASTPQEVPADVVPANQTPAGSKPKPDPKAILAAARAKKELEAANVRVADEVATASTLQEVPVDVLPANQAPAGSRPKPDPKAILAAARAKKELEAGNVRVADEVASESTPQEVPADVVPANQTPAGPKLKPDPKALLAAARAKKELAEQPPQPVPTIGTVAEVKTPNSPKPRPDPKAMLAAGRNKSAANPAAKIGDSTSSIVSGPESSSPQSATSTTTAVAAKPKPLGSITAGSSIGDPSQRKVEDARHRRIILPPNDLQKGELKRVYLQLIQPCLGPQKATPAWKESIRKAILACRVRQTGQHPDFIPIFEQLQDYCEQRQQFEFIKSYHFWMHRWLIIHIPATVALYVVLIVHGIMALRVIPFGN